MFHTLPSSKSPCFTAKHTISYLPLSSSLSLSVNMWSSLPSCLTKFHIHKTQETRNSKAKNCVYRDELNYNESSSRSKLRERTNYGDLSHQIGEPLLIQKKDKVKDIDMGSRSCGYGGDCRSSVEKKGVNTRVKVLMTKEEAARLLSKCKDQKGTLEFRDVVHELVRIPTGRIHVVSTASTCHDTFLYSIPEEE
ncbi:hypothetical protein Ancab_032819 [Ancistrocladus abbreviatus]